MSIAEQITRLQGAKDGLKTALEGKAVTVPADAKLDAYPQLVKSIDTGEYARPASWIQLPDISNSQKETIVMLFHIAPTGTNEIAFNFETYEEPFTTFQIDWGDGTIENTDTTEHMGNGYGIWHSYDYASLDAPVVENGEKEVIVRIENIGAVAYKGDFSLNNSVSVHTVDGKSKTIYNETEMLKDMKVYCPPSNVDFGVVLNYALGLVSFDVWNNYAVKINGGHSLRSAKLFGENINNVTFSSCYNLGKLQLPENQFLTFTIGNAPIEQLEIDASGLTTISLVGLTNLRKLKLNGCQKAFSLSYPKMDRAAFLELFESLGTVTESTRIRFTGSSVARSLSDEDKAIATDKGWALMFT